MMLERKQCLICRKNKTALNDSNRPTLSGISEVKIRDKPVLLTDSSILFCIMNAYNTVSTIREALDNAYFKDKKDPKIIFGGRTEGNLRARLKVLEQLGLIFANYTQNKRVPKYTITNLGVAVQATFMAGLDLFTKACSDCIVSQLERAVKPIEIIDNAGPGQKEELSY